MTEQTHYSGGLCVGNIGEPAVSDESGIQELRGIMGLSMIFTAIDNIRIAFGRKTPLSATDTDDTDNWSEPICIR